LVEPVEVKRRFAAIFAADVEGYSRLMGADEVAALAALTAHREILDGLIGTHGGRTIWAAWLQQRLNENSADKAENFQK
jgi:class 3 adenylate cyclase